MDNNEQLTTPSKNKNKKKNTNNGTPNSNKNKKNNKVNKVLTRSQRKKMMRKQNKQSQYPAKFAGRYFHDTTNNGNYQANNYDNYFPRYKRPRYSNEGYGGSPSHSESYQTTPPNNNRKFPKNKSSIDYIAPLPRRSVSFGDESLLVSIEDRRKNKANAIEFTNNHPDNKDLPNDAETTNRMNTDLRDILKAKSLNTSHSYRRSHESDVRPIYESNENYVFSWLIKPGNTSIFTSEYWEKRPLLINRSQLDYYDVLNVNTNTFDEILRENDVQFGKNIDITSYTNGVRETHNPVGRAHPHIVWDFFKNGCSIRLLNPQTFFKTVYRLCEKLQYFFNGFVGANMYLTPPNSQGFAPHYDDIEAFVLQLQGVKYWKVYKPRSDSEKLPRYSSQNFKNDEIGEPILEVALRPGDLLYFPRGFIHQASTRDQLSLHITLSAYQSTAYVDLLEKILPKALEKATNECVEFRKGLPLNLGSEIGEFNNHNGNLANSIKQKVKQLAFEAIRSIDINSAVDEFIAKHLHDRLPPYFSNKQKNVMVFNNSTNISEDCKTIDLIQLQMTSSVRLTNPQISRLVKTNGGQYLLYHSTNNSLEYHGKEEEFLEVSEEHINAFRQLYNKYPKYIDIKDLSVESDEEKWSFANSLWEVGLLMTKYPLKPVITNFDDYLNDSDENDEEKTVEANRENENSELNFIKETNEDEREENSCIDEEVAEKTNETNGGDDIKVEAFDENGQEEEDDCVILKPSNISDEVIIVE